MFVLRHPDGRDASRRFGPYRTLPGAIAGAVRVAKAAAKDTAQDAIIEVWWASDYRIPKLRELSVTIHHTEG